jgi:DNA-binding beta-propeller fold protein YncE
LFGLTTDTPAERTIDLPGSPQCLVFSPSGSAAALYSAGSLQVIKGLPDAPVVAANIRLRINPRLGRALPETLAVSDDGAYVLYSTGGPIEMIGVAGDSRQVMAGGGTGSLAAFAPGGHDAAIVDSEKLILFQNIAGAATQRRFAGIAAPSAVAFSADSQKLFVASATGRTVTSIQVASGDRAAVACDCAPAALIPMGSVIRLTELSNEPLWLLDTASDRVVFVPAPVTN